MPPQTCKIRSAHRGKVTPSKSPHHLAQPPHRLGQAQNQRNGQPLPFHRPICVAGKVFLKWRLQKYRRLIPAPVRSPLLSTAPLNWSPLSRRLPLGKHRLPTLAFSVSQSALCEIPDCCKIIENCVYFIFAILTNKHLALKRKGRHRGRKILLRKGAQPPAITYNLP
jgi:hypothetical protein